MAKPRVVVLGEKPQGEQWLSMLIESDLFTIIAGVPRRGSQGWWGSDGFESLLRKHSIPVVERGALASMDYDILWSLMYGFIIEAPLIERARWFGLNLHESPLPLYRGCNGYSHAILEGASTFGTSFHFLAAELDAGALIDQEIFPIDPQETSRELYLRTMDISQRVFARNLERTARRELPSTPLDVSSEPIRKRSSLLELKPITEATMQNKELLWRQVRAFDFPPFEPAYIEQGTDRWYLWVDESEHRPSLREKAEVVTWSPGMDALLDSAHRAPLVLLEGFPRPLLLGSRDAYAAHFPLFLPRYSWMKKEDSPTVGA